MGEFWLFAQLYGAPVIMAAVSATYFFADQRRPAFRARLISSAHGVIGVALYFGAMAVSWAQPHGYRPYLGAPYLSLYVLPLIAIIVALFEFRGPRLIHLLQIANVAALTWSLFIGVMYITGHWL